MKQIAAALVKAQKEFAPALKASTNPHFKSKYVDLAGCVDAVIDALNTAGVFLTQKTHLADGGVVVETAFLHESGEEYSAGQFYCPASKQDAQGYGSATTYARRYALMAACGIAPEDDDGNAAVKATNNDKYRLLAQYEEEAKKGLASLQSFIMMTKGALAKEVWLANRDRLKAMAEQVKEAA